MSAKNDLGFSHPLFASTIDDNFDKSENSGYNPNFIGVGISTAESLADCGGRSAIVRRFMLHKG